jgi:hypothetical protein
MRRQMQKDECRCGKPSYHKKSESFSGDFPDYSGRSGTSQHGPVEYMSFLWRCWFVEALIFDWMRYGRQCMGSRGWNASGAHDRMWWQTCMKLVFSYARNAAPMISLSGWRLHYGRYLKFREKDDPWRYIPKPLVDTWFYRLVYSWDQWLSPGQAVETSEYDEDWHTRTTYECNN